jgi:GrpB-like predicted nucleotidyltransferase (UPF0157 family)
LVADSLCQVTIELHDYDARWPDLAATACAELTAAVPGLFVTIEHVGSTSVAGMAAKPVIDLMAATETLDTVLRVEDVLGRLGYHRGETGMRNRLFYARNAPEDDTRRTHHLHVVTVDTWDTRNERLLRDHLRAHPEDAVRYAALKQRIRREGHAGDAYTRAKTALIQELVDQARADRGLPSVPVWED